MVQEGLLLWVLQVAVENTHHRSNRWFTPLFALIQDLAAHKDLGLEGDQVVLLLHLVLFACTSASCFSRRSLARWFCAASNGVFVNAHAHLIVFKQLQRMFPGQRLLDLLLAEPECVNRATTFTGKSAGKDGRVYHNKCALLVLFVEDV